MVNCVRGTANEGDPKAEEYQMQDTPILGFHSFPRDTKDNRHSGHVGVSNKRNNQNSFVKSTPKWPP